jgi:nucleotide-binding universal stress UspA family protein
MHVKAFAKDGSIGEIIVLNVVGAAIPCDEIMNKEIDLNASRQKLANRSQEYLTEVASRLSAEGIKVKTESIEATDPSLAIIAYAQNNDIDLIIITTHGYTGKQERFFGSVTENVLRESYIPVLVIRPKSH